MTATPEKPVRLPAPPKLEADDYGIFVETPLGSHVLSMGIEYRDLAPEVARRWNVHEALVDAVRGLLADAQSTYDYETDAMTEARVLLKAEADHAE